MKGNVEYISYERTNTNEKTKFGRSVEMNMRLNFLFPLTSDLFLIMGQLYYCSDYQPQLIGYSF